MLQTIASLGRVSANDAQKSSNISHVIGMVFKYNHKGKIEYHRSELHQFEDARKYLFKRDSAGQGAGLFLCGNIPLKEFKDLLTTGEKRISAIDRKIMWFPHGKLVVDNELMAKLDSYKRKELSAIFQEFRDKQDKISIDVINTLRPLVPKEILLTIMIQTNKGDAKFPGEIPKYVDFFRKGKLSKKKGTSEKRLVKKIAR
jgi:hypothetical protein